ncbi:MAG: hypothetical protein CL845_05435 [Crocinitomicaceae bacterium]|nr:hypothetical protein [Crocinitomicaceae bacterium]HBP44553.1 hypothetical protein [Flavobacteriales bacterium]
MRGDLNDTGISREVQLRHTLMPLTWGALIFGLHAIPGTDLPKETFLDLLHVDKATHLAMFAVLSSSVFVALGKTGMIRKYKWYAVLALVLYGIGLEFAQDMWFVGRQASWGDMLADSAGVLAGRFAFRCVYGCWN